MTDNEIKKALERLKSTKDYLKEQYQEQVKKCPYPELKPIAKQTYEDNKKAFDIAIKAIEEFNRLQAENERLKKENTILSQNADTAFQDGLNEAQDLYAEQVKAEIKTEAYKEFFQLIHKEFVDISNGYFESKNIDACVVMQGAIDKLRETYKGMVGDKK